MKHGIIFDTNRFQQLQFEVEKFARQCANTILKEGGETLSATDIEIIAENVAEKIQQHIPTEIKTLKTRRNRPAD